jgi:hypothetical protein
MNSVVQHYMQQLRLFLMYEGIKANKISDTPTDHNEPAESMTDHISSCQCYNQHNFSNQLKPFIHQCLSEQRLMLL